MFIIPGRCPTCYAHWGNSEYCIACGCLAEIYYERELPPKERINAVRVQGIINAARGRLTQYANDGMAHYVLGLSYIHLNLIEEGLDELRKAADILPEKVGIRYEASAISVRHGLKSEEVLNQLNVVLSRQPDFKQALYLRGVVLEQ